MTLRERIDELNPWFYDFELNGERVTSGVYPPGEGWDSPHERLLPRQKQRRTLIIDATVERIDMRGKSILDVGCNCAFWSSIFVAEHGARSIDGIEGRERFVKQAGLVFEEKAIGTNCGVCCHDATAWPYELWTEGFWDVVLCAGLLYHVPDPVDLIGRLAYVCGETMLIDTRIAPERVLGDEPENRHFNSLEGIRQSVIPTKASILTAMSAAGFETEVIPPTWEHGEGCVGLDSYHHGRRMFVIGRRR